ncbi:hypothetical protein I3679_002855 [Proteus mirabilis]|uniref:Uncharacterized protein n=1 Tax=Proteus mirabilis TaxID=584 RepID=A0ABD5LUC9_PROMI
MYDRAKWPTFFATTTAFWGDTLNTALYLARLIPTLHPQYITGLGTDNYSALMQKAWEKEGSTASQ